MKENETNYKRMAICFWAMIVMWIASARFEVLSSNLLFDLGWLFFGIATFVTSIIQVRKKRNAFVITSLVLSSLLLFLFFLGFMVGVIITIAGY